MAWIQLQTLRIFENMGICNNSPAGSPKYIVIYFLAICCVQLADEAPCANALSFNFTSIRSQYQNVNITTYGNAYISDQGIQVTTDDRGVDRSQRAGRATYFEPLHLWDKTSGNLTDFSTYFAFVIDSTGNPDYGDGLAFFIAPTADVPNNITTGSTIGLPINNSTQPPVFPFLAVEFDTYPNGQFDPKTSFQFPFTHVGININSITSNVTQEWSSNITGGATNEAWITYNSSSKNLSVVFSTSFVNNETIEGALHFIVDLRHYLPEWVKIGFSASTGSSFEKNNVKSWSFSSSLVDPKKTASSPLSKGLVVGLSVGLPALVLVLALAGYVFWKKTRAENEFAIELSMDNEFEAGTGPKKFSYNELSWGTSNFAEEQKLGEGGFGGVYRGFLRELNSYVAVKRVSKGSTQGIREYASEVKIISLLRHRNLVQLVGWCHEKKQLLLVYEFMENGSLDSHLFKQKTLLTWAIRCKIAQGLASALLYLHEEWEQCVVHRDVKSSNVMLDSNFNAKLGDFGLARLVDHDKGSQTTIVLAGTRGYMAPEYVVTGKASKESDVYSFGVVALEITCGRKAIDNKVPESQMILVQWVWDLYGIGQLLEAVDPKIGADFDLQEMERLMIVGLWCAHPDHNLRPPIRQAIQVLNCEAPLPILPATMPVATYFAPPLNSLTSLVSSTYGTNFSDSSQVQSSSYSYNTDSSKVTSSSASASASLLYSTTR
ncbi:L-type lectin-domain containing receptor kinase IX.1-like isoform X1 [Diospyros lotus]|uniref:L-type lectin-domain containing receptor kinase IX.1-like isoform X1 n=1 Tax=Diospyros lotus TaxID=55363 RepID=UPI00225A8A42|nr:L-type lectin-domain containing receptor kinase IX.1-like isoform X1 [Diospyros lotus]